MKMCSKESEIILHAPRNVLLDMDMDMYRYVQVLAKVLRLEVVERIVQRTLLRCAHDALPASPCTKHRGTMLVHAFTEDFPRKRCFLFTTPRN